MGLSPRWSIAAAIGLSLAACSGPPAALAITGPGNGNFASPASATSSPASLQPGPDTVAAPTPSAADDETAVQAPGLPPGLGERYAPTVAPTYGSDGRYYGYN